jgi:hypothetical protein
LWPLSSRVRGTFLVARNSWTSVCVTTQRSPKTRSRHTRSRTVARPLHQVPPILPFMLHLDVASCPARRARPCGARMSTVALATLDPASKTMPLRRGPRVKFADETILMLASLSVIILATTPLSADALLASPKRDLPRSPEVRAMELSRLDASILTVR